MSFTVMFVAALILLPAVGLATWAWFSMARVEEDLRSFTGFEGMHFDIGPRAAQSCEGGKWPIPG